MQGKIIRGIGGFFYVHTENGVYACRARGILRRENIRPLPGDLVRIQVLDEAAKEGSIEEIVPRKNALIRPAVANIDQALVIFSVVSPRPNFNLLDRFLVSMERQGIGSVLVFNKTDLAQEGQRQEIAERYGQSGYPLLFVSARTTEGIERIRKILLEKTTTVAGPSGVGKSSLINLLQTQRYMDTGEISSKIERGKHTTRHTELLWVEENTYILDTPGFSSVELPDVPKEELGALFPEIRSRRDGCRFSGCSHLSEPDCRVLQALADGEIGRERYESYRLFYEEIKGRRRYANASGQR